MSTDRVEALVTVVWQTVWVEGSHFRLKAGLVIAVAVAGVVGAAIWLATSWLSTYRQVQAFQTEVTDFRAAITARDWSSVAERVPSLRESSQEVGASTQRLPWLMLESVPFVGPSAAAVGDLALSANALATAALPLTPYIETVLDGGIRRPDGSIDFTVINALTPLLERLGTAVVQEAARLDTVDVAQLRPEIAEPLVELRDQLHGAASGLAVSGEVAAQLPALLGADGERTWLVVLQNPAEARGTGGFPGGYVVIGADEGALSVVSAGKSGDLNALPIPVDGAPADSQLLWGRFLTEWRSFNLSPHFPLTGSLAAASMQSRGIPVDGVLAVDPAVVAALLEVTGPVTAAGVTLTAENAEQFFLVDIYQQFPDMGQRTDLSLALVRAVLSAFLASDWDPALLAEALRAPISEGRVRAWSADPEEQAWLATTLVGGSVPDTPGSVIAVAFNNASGNKMDAFVGAEVQYNPGRCATKSTQDSSLRIKLRNAAPEDLPPNRGDYGRQDDQSAPAGSTKMLVHFYAPIGASYLSSTLDGLATPLYSGEERGRPVWWTYVTLMRGQQAVIDVRFQEPYVSTVMPAALPQGMAIPEVISVQPQYAC